MSEKNFFFMHVIQLFKVDNAQETEDFFSCVGLSSNHCRVTGESAMVVCLLSIHEEELYCSSTGKKGKCKAAQFESIPGCLNFNFILHYPLLKVKCLCVC